MTPLQKAKRTAVQTTKEYIIKKWLNDAQVLRLLRHNIKMEVEQLVNLAA